MNMKPKRCNIILAIVMVATILGGLFGLAAPGKPGGAFANEGKGEAPNLLKVVEPGKPGLAFADEEKGELPNLLEVIGPGLQVLLEALAVAIVPFLAYHAKRYADEAVQRVKQALTTEQYLMVEIVVKNLVHAAQQLFDYAECEAKKKYVIEQAQKVLAGYGLQLDLAHLEAMIESMVHQELKGPSSLKIP